MIRLLLFTLLGTALGDVSFVLNGRNGKQTEECGQYREWRSELNPDGKYSFISVSAPGKDEFRCSNALTATRICNYISEGEHFTGISCGGAKWSSGGCGSDTTNQDLVGSSSGYEIRVTEGGNNGICQCSDDAQTAILRPCLGNQNWGGMREMTCNWSNSDDHSVDMAITCTKHDTHVLTIGTLHDYSHDGWENKGQVTLTNYLESVTCSASNFKDQGWGYQKSRVRLVLLDSDGNEMGSEDCFGVAPHSWSGAKSVTFGVESDIVKWASPGSTLQVQ